MYDANVLPYDGGDPRNAIVDALAEAERDGDQDAVERYARRLAAMGHEYGDTPARRRTGVSDMQAARWPEPSLHGDGYDADDASRPVNGLGTYFETDAAW